MIRRLLAVLLLGAIIAAAQPQRSLAQAGSVLGWGNNAFGQLGDNTTTNHSLPASAFYVSGIKQVSAGGSHTLALTSDGHVYAWGYNSYGEVGDGTTTTRTTPVLLTGIDHVIAISAGIYHSLALRDDGTVWGWGRADLGELAIAGSSQTTPAFTGGSNVKAIAAGGSHSICLTQDGTVWTTGYNGYGELGLGDNVNRTGWNAVPNLPRIKAIAAGSDHTVVLSATGRVYSTGFNPQGELGDGTTTSRNTFVFSNVGNARAIGTGCYSYHTVAVRLDGSVAAWGWNLFGQLGDNTTTNRLLPVTVGVVANVKDVAAGYNHSLFLLASGKAMACGSNSAGQLGDGTTTQRLLPVAVSGSGLYQGISASIYGSVALKSWAAAKAWGYNASGQLGIGTTTDKHAPTAMTGLISGVIQLASGYYHTLALKADGTVWATGLNGSGQLGIGSTLDQTKAVKIPTLTNVIAIACGGYHSLALTADGWVWAWGLNGNGQLGQGDTLNRLAPVHVGWGAFAVAAGGYHSAALVGDGDLWTWGLNSWAELGVGDTSDRWLPELVPGTSGTLAASASWLGTMIINADGSLSIMGYDYYGQLGAGNGFYASPVPIAGTQAVAISSSDAHGLHLNTGGYVYSSGAGDNGRLALGSTTWYNSWQTVGFGLNGISASNASTYVSTSTGAVLAAGYNAFGQVGDGSVIDRLALVFVPGLPYCVGLSQGPGYHMAALTNPPVMASSLKVSPTTVVGGANSTATVTLTAAAGPGGLIVKLSSNKAAATVPATVTVLPGAKTASFLINTSGVGAVTVATITSTLNGSKTANLTINP